MAVTNFIRAANKRASLQVIELDLAQECDEASTQQVVFERE
jgi:hypothetical protein